MAGKSIYQLMIDNEIISAVDRLAARNGLSRSAMVERILSDRIAYMSPLGKVSEIYREIQRLISAVDGFTAYAPESGAGFMVKSAIARYRPSVRYRVTIYDRLSDGDFGQLSAQLRSDDRTVLENAEDFFRTLTRLEKVYLSPTIRNEINCGYDIGSGRYVRGLRLNGESNHTASEISQSITDYVSMIDTMMKRWFGREYLSVSDMENDYLSYLNAGIGII